MIMVRRVLTPLPIIRLYELRLEEAGHLSGSPLILRRGMAVRRLEALVGVGDAWTLLRAADKALGQPGEGWVSLVEDQGS